MSTKAMSFADAMDHNARLHKSRGSEKVLDRIELKESENGGHIVRHSYSNGNSPTYHEPEEYTFGKSEGKQLIAHLTKHANIKVTKADSDDEGGQDK